MSDERYKVTFTKCDGTVEVLDNLRDYELAIMGLKDWTNIKSSTIERVELDDAPPYVGTGGGLMEVHRSDLDKLRDVLVVAARHHVSRDEMNAALHLSAHARYSPLTSELVAAKERVEQLLRGGWKCPNDCVDPKPGWWFPGPQLERPPCSICDAPLEKVP